MDGQKGGYFTLFVSLCKKTNKKKNVHVQCTCESFPLYSSNFGRQILKKKLYFEVSHKDYPNTSTVEFIIWASELSFTWMWPGWLTNENSQDCLSFMWKLLLSRPPTHPPTPAPSPNVRILGLISPHTAEVLQPVRSIVGLLPTGPGEVGGFPYSGHAAHGALLLRNGERIHRA